MYRRGIEWLVTNSRTGRDEKAIFEIDLKRRERGGGGGGERAGARGDGSHSGSRGRWIAHTCERPRDRQRREKDIGDAAAEVREYDRGVSAAYALAASYASCTIEGPPLAVFKARNVAPSRGMRQSIITVLHIDTTVQHRARVRTHTHIHDHATFTNARLAPCSLPLSLSLSRSVVLSTSATRTHRELMTPPRIILVPRISSARYCHRERLMFRRNLSSLFYARTHACERILFGSPLSLCLSLSLVSPRSRPRTRVDTSSAIEGEIMSFRDSWHESTSLPLSPGREPPPPPPPPSIRSCTGCIEGSMNLPSYNTCNRRSCMFWQT